MEEKKTEADAVPSESTTAPLSGATASAIPASSTETPQTLEEALDNIRELYEQEEAAKWGQGEQVNFMEEAHLALRKGYKNGRECLKREMPDLPRSSLFRIAYLAKYYPQEHRKRWGIAKLQVLAGIQKQTHGNPLPGDPADHEVLIPRGDGSMVAKKFRDCTLRELQSAAKSRKQTREGAGRVVQEGAKESTPLSKQSLPMRALAIIGIGLLGGFIGNSMLPSVPGLVISVLSGVLVVIGTAMLVRYLVAVRERFFAALKAGEVKLRTVKEQGMEVLRNGRHFLAILKEVHSQPKAPTESKKTPPPSEKKAA